MIDPLMSSLDVSQIFKENTMSDLNILLIKARAIRPDVRYVIQENYCGDIIGQYHFWAHSSRQAWCGETPEQLLADIRKSAGGVA